jgi:cell fate regulator YaaT (PSP1 superfamily)
MAAKKLAVVNSPAAEAPTPERWDEEALLYRVIRVRLEDGGLTREVDAVDEFYRRGEVVVVELEGNRVIGEVISEATRVLRREAPPRALRRAGDDDVRHEAALRKKERQMLETARQIAGTLAPGLKVIRVAVMRAQQRVVVHAVAEERIDGRAFLRRLSAVTQARIALRVVGAREAAKQLGGVGPCGLQLCCSTFLEGFAPVTMKMAKDQGLAMTPQRVSGLCGRLLCCLVYEEAFYRQQREGLPKIGARVVSEQGPGRVRDVDVLSRTISVVLESGDTLQMLPEALKPG